jgi:hypothetical protein
MFSLETLATYFWQYWTFGIAALSENVIICVSFNIHWNKKMFHQVEMCYARSHESIKPPLEMMRTTENAFIIFLFCNSYCSVKTDYKHSFDVKTTILEASRTARVWNLRPIYMHNNTSELEASLPHVFLAQSLTNFWEIPSSGCGWRRQPLDMEGNCSGQLTRGGPPSCGLGEGLTPPHNKVLACYEM